MNYSGQHLLRCTGSIIALYIGCSSFLRCMNGNAVVWILRPILERLAERKEHRQRLPSTMLQKQHFSGYWHNPWGSEGWSWRKCRSIFGESVWGSREGCWFCFPEGSKCENCRSRLSCCWEEHQACLVWFNCKMLAWLCPDSCLTGIVLDWLMICTGALSRLQLVSLPCSLLHMFLLATR